MDAISCLAPLPFLSASASASASPYTDAAIATALRFSMSSDSSSSSTSYYAPSSANLFADFASASPPAPVVSSCCDSVTVAHSPATSRAAARKQQASSRLGPAAAGAGAGRAGKRRPRASKRAPTTYISTDTSNFRLMVQHVTGAQPDPGVLLPTPAFHDAVLLDLDAAPIFGGHPLVPADDDTAALRHQQQQQQQQEPPCFPTLNSWSVMYESSDLAAALTQH